jgi:hypothetical protein
MTLILADFNNLGKSFVGMNLIPHGDGFTSIGGPNESNGAVRIAQGSYYCFVQTSLQNNDDGEFFLRSAGNLGIGDTGYSEYVATVNEWHRLVISASMGNAYDYYIDNYSDR